MRDQAEKSWYTPLGEQGRQQEEGTDSVLTQSSEAPGREVCGAVCQAVLEEKNQLKILARWRQQEATEAMRIYQCPLPLLPPSVSFLQHLRLQSEWGEEATLLPSGQ